MEMLKQVLCWAFAMHLPRSLPQKCRCVISNFGQREACQVSSPVVGATHPYPGKNWKPALLVAILNAKSDLL